MALRRMTIFLASATLVGFALMPYQAGADAAGTTPQQFAVRLVRFIPAPKGTAFGDPVWVSRYQRLVVTVFTPPSRGDIYLASMRPDGSTFKRIAFPRRQGCVRTTHANGRAVNSTDLALLERCFGSGPPEQSVRLLQYSLGSKTLRRIYEHSIPYGTRAIEINRQGGDWLINDGYGLEEHLAWLRPTGIEQLPLTFTRIGDPAWAPDGHAIAVFAKQSGPAIEGPWSLYLLRPNGTPFRRLSQGLTEVWRPTWSPDSRYLVFYAKGPRRQAGLWMLNVQSGRMTLLRRGRTFGTCTWLASTRLVVPVGKIRFDNQPSREKTGLQVFVLRLPNS